MFDKKSEYALNKYDQDSIIYISLSVFTSDEKTIKHDTIVGANV